MALDLTEARAQLARTPGTLQAWFGALPEAWLTADEGADTFSARDVLAHLIHGERTDWMARVRRIREEGEARPFDPFDRFAFLEAARGWPVAELLAEFARLRADNLRALEALSLTPEDLTRTGRHPALGVVTLENLLATWVVHDLGHLAQAARVMAKRYTADVGPWAEYLPILTRR